MDYQTRAKALKEQGRYEEAIRQAKLGVERKYNGLSTAQYIFLIMQDDLHFDDETIAAILDVKRVSVRSMRARIKKRDNWGTGNL